MEISPITPTQTGAAKSVNKPAEAKSVLASDFETFLKMMTAQAKSQDPLDPMDSSEYASQLAQFSMVEQQVKTNDLLDNLAGALGGSTLSSLSQWIGMDALNTSLAYFDGAPVSVSAPINSAADARFLVVRDSTGGQVQRIRIPDSLQGFEWTGVQENGSQLPSGKYRLEIEAMSKGEVLSVDPAASYARVTEARITNNQTVLVLKGGAELSSADVTGLREGAVPFTQ